MRLLHNTPRCAVIVVTYNSKSTIRPCLTPVVTLPDFEIIVVDNASVDGTPAVVAQEFPSARLIVNRDNSGFARACNIGVAASRAPFILLLNPDTVASPEAVRILLDFLEQHPKAGVVGARLLDPSGRPLQSMADRPSLWRLALDKPLAVLAQGAGPTGALRRLAGALSAKYCLPDHPCRAAIVGGAAFCSRRAAWELVGGFDEAFFLYCEDADLCLRIARAGWEVWHVPEAVVLHQSGASFAGDLERQKREYYASLRYFFRKHNGVVATCLLDTALRLYRGLRLYRWFGRDRIGRPFTATQNRGD